MRDEALDALRGLTIAVMILVNYAGPLPGVPWPLAHAAWTGCTVADAVFPAFLVIVGMSLAHAQPTPAQMAKRAAVLFLIGFGINAFPFVGVDWGTVTIMGVLQRIAICYLAAGLLRRHALPVAVALLLGYWALLQLGDDTLDGNVCVHVDRAVFGAAHLNHDYPAPFEPEGLLSTIPAIAQVLLGYACVTRPRRGLVGAAIVMMLVARLWDAWLPIGKPLWTSSFVLWTTGLTWLAYALVSALPRPPILVTLGRQALAIYVASTLIKGVLVYTGSDRVVHGWLGGGPAGAVAYGVMAVSLAMLAARVRARAASRARARPRSAGSPAGRDR